MKKHFIYITMPPKTSFYAEEHCTVKVIPKQIESEGLMRQ